MSASLPRFIAPASVDIGDTITVATQRGDVKETATATVGRIVRTATSVTFISPDGNAFGAFRYGSTVRVLLVARGVAYEPEPLFADIEALSDVYPMVG